MGKVKHKKQSLIKRVSGFQKLFFCITLSTCVYIIMSIFQLEILSRIVLGWDTFCLSMISLSWILFFSTTYEDQCAVFEKQDDGIKVIFTIVIISAFFSVFGTLLLLIEKNEADKRFHMLVSMSTIVLSWILLHTIFTIRYAHLYHDHNKLNTGSNIGGIDFPKETQPDYVDFAYFSFVIGMTFQVSDIIVTSRVIRRFVLMHGLISFVFNTIIVALAINTISNLNK